MFGEWYIWIHKSHHYIYALADLSQKLRLCWNDCWSVQEQFLFLSVAVNNRLFVLILICCLAVVVFITPIDSCSAAATGPAPLTLQSRLAQESVVVWRSPRSLSTEPSHDFRFHPRKCLGAPKTGSLESWYQCGKALGQVLMQCSVYCRLHLKVSLQMLTHIYLKSSNAVSIKSTPLWHFHQRKRRWNNQTSTSA